MSAKRCTRDHVSRQAKTVTVTVSLAVRAYNVSIMLSDDLRSQGIVAGQGLAHRHRVLLPQHSAMLGIGDEDIHSAGGEVRQRAVPPAHT